MVTQIRKPKNEGTLFRKQLKKKFWKTTEKDWDSLKGSKKWIVWKWNVEMLKENLIIWSKYRLSFEKWIFGNSMGLIF